MMQPESLDWLPTPNMSVVEAATRYIEHGLRVCIVHAVVDGKCTCNAVPGACKPGKHPVLNAWQKKIYATADEFRDALGGKRIPKAFNLGIVLGPQLDGTHLLAIDVDDAERLKVLEATLGALPGTLMSRSGGGGAHRLYMLGREQDPQRMRNRGGVRLSSEDPSPGIDVRWTGGQIVVCPSLHVSGERYAWANQLPIAELPQRWYDVIAEPIVTRVPRAPSSRPNVTSLNHKYIERVIENAANDISSRGKGERNTVLHAKACTVLEYCAGAGLSFDYALDRLQNAGRACGLPDAEVRATLRKAEARVRSSGKTKTPPEPPSRPGVSPPQPPTPPGDGDGGGSEDDDGGGEDDSEAWRTYLVVKKGQYENCLANVMSVLSEHPEWKGVLQYDMFRETVVFTRPPPCRPQDVPLNRPQGNVWLETDDTRTQAWFLQHIGFEPAKTAVMDAVQAVAERSSVHPVRAYLEGLIWDGEERLPTFLANCFGATPGQYTAGIGTCWMISCVARVMRPGEQVDYMIGLEGNQGIGKSSGLRTLCPLPSWYSDTGVTIGQKDSYISLHGKWIFCFDELDSIKGSDVTKTKNFLTSTSDNFRPPWGRRNRDYPRQTCFAYTTNEGHYLRDRTGNRRWWPFQCTRVDRERIARERDQLWAEARVRFERGERWWPDPELEVLCKEHQTERQVDDAWTDLIANWLSTDEAKRIIARHEGILSHEILTGALSIRPGDIQRSHEMRVAEILRDLGWTPGKQRRDPDNWNRRVRRYSPPEKAKKTP